MQGLGFRGLGFRGLGFTECLVSSGIGCYFTCSTLGGFKRQGQCEGALVAKTGQSQRAKKRAGLVELLLPCRDPSSVGCVTSASH